MIETQKAPLELMTQDPETGLYRYGSMELTAAEYDIRLTLNKIIDEVSDLRKRVTSLEGV